MSFPAHETVPVLTAQALADLVNAETALITKLYRQQEELVAALHRIVDLSDDHGHGFVAGEIARAALDQVKQ